MQSLSLRAPTCRQSMIPGGMAKRLRYHCGYFSTRYDNSGQAQPDSYRHARIKMIYDRPWIVDKVSKDCAAAMMIPILKRIPPTPERNSHAPNTAINKTQSPLLNSTQFVDGKDRQAKTTPKITIEQTIIAAILLSQPAEKRTNGITK